MAKGNSQCESYDNAGKPARMNLTNPPFNMSEWGDENLRSDVCWKFGMPPVNNANYTWIQHFIHHLSPVGVAGFVMANGSMSTQTSNEGEIRKALIEADLVDCMVALPGQLFFTTPIPVRLWFLAKSKAADARCGVRAAASKLADETRELALQDFYGEMCIH